MQKLILTVLLLFSGLTATQGWSNGSKTVFLPVRLGQYMLSDNLELAANPKLYDFVETVADNIFVALVQANSYKYVRYLALVGYEVDIEFEYYETVTFRYYSALDAIIGQDSKGDLIVLSPN